MLLALASFTGAISLRRRTHNVDVELTGSRVTNPIDLPSGAIAPLLKNELCGGMIENATGACGFDRSRIHITPVAIASTASSAVAIGQIFFGLSTTASTAEPSPIHSNSFATSRALCQRFSGSFSKHVAMT